jgi:hypothetical protein
MRDKRGYESLYVMHAYRPTPQEPHRTRVLYMFRSPSHVGVGRQPLDAEVMEALEHTHPDLSFDWQALTRERAAARVDLQERPARSRSGPSRSGPPRSGPPRAVPPRPSPMPQRPTPAAPIDDGSVLGKVLGGVEAAALRRRYADLIDRVTRRARTPEDRDRLLERARRLNPDDWADEAAVRAALPSISADWGAIAIEVPGRRRGRRGGRRRGPAGAPGPGPVEPRPSGIMGEDDSSHASPGTTLVDRPDGDSGARGDGGGGDDDGADTAIDSTETGLHDDD